MGNAAASREDASALLKIERAGAVLTVGLNRPAKRNALNDGIIHAIGDCFADLPGVRFLPVRFTPVDSVFKGQSCAGVNIVLTDREHCNVVDIGLTIGEVLNRLYPEQFKVDKMDVLMGNKATLAANEPGGFTSPEAPRASQRVRSRLARIPRSVPGTGKC